MVATSALGMGYDKPNLAFVVHFQVPGLGGRVLPAGRPGGPRDRPGVRRSRSSGREDRQIQDWFISTAFPTREHAEQVVALIADHGDWVKLAEIERDVNLRRGRLTNMLKVLEVEGVVERDGQKWRRTRTAVGVPAGAGRGGHRAPPRGTGAHARVPRGLGLPDGVPAPRARRSAGGAVRSVRALPRPRPVPAHRRRSDLARDAVDFLRNQWFALEPRKQWPDGTRIPVDRASRARAHPRRHAATAAGAAPVEQQQAAGAYSATSSSTRWSS